MSIELSPVQIALLSVIASIVVLILRLIYEAAKQAKWVAPDWVKTVVVYIAAFVVGILFFPRELPTLPTLPAGDVVGIVSTIVGYLGELFALLTFYVAVAVIVYDKLLIAVKEKLGEALLPRVYKKP